MSSYFLQTEVDEELKIRLEVFRTKRGWTTKKLLRVALKEFLKQNTEFEEKLNRESTRTG